MGTLTHAYLSTHSTTSYTCTTPTKELEQLQDFDPNALSRLLISSRAHILFDSHREVDGMLEAEKVNLKR